MMEEEEEDGGDNNSGKRNGLQAGSDSSSASAIGCCRKNFSIQGIRDRWARFTQDREEHSFWFFQPQDK